MLQYLAEDVLYHISRLHAPSVFSVKVQCLRQLALLRQVSYSLKNSIDQSVDGQEWIEAADSFFKQQTIHRRKLQIYLRSLRIKSALPHLWTGHPLLIYELIAEFPNMARQTMHESLSHYAYTRQFHLLERYSKHATELLIDGLLHGFGKAAHNRGEQLQLLRWGAKWLSPGQKKSLMKAVSDHPHLLERVAESFYLRVPSSQKRKLPLSFSSLNSKRSFLKQHIR